MTTTLIIDGSMAPEPDGSSQTGTGRVRPQRAAAGATLSFSGLLRSERIKLLSLRSIRWTLAITVVLGWGFSALIGWIGSDSLNDLPVISANDYQGYLVMVATFAAPFLALIFGVLGVLGIASEYSSGMILSTLTAAPRRGLLFAAKALIIAALSAVTGLILIGGGLLIAGAFLPAALAHAGSLVVVSGLLGAAAYFVLLALMGFGIAALTRSTAGGVAIIAGLTFVLPIALQLLTITDWAWVPELLPYTPDALGAQLAQGTNAVDPGFGVAFAALGAWTLVTLIPAAFALQRRDAR